MHIKISIELGSFVKNKTIFVINLGLSVFLIYYKIYVAKLNNNLKKSI